MTDAELREARLIRAAKRILGDTSDEVWCDNDDDPWDDAKLLARNVLASGRADDGDVQIDDEWLESIGFGSDNTNDTISWDKSGCIMVNHWGMEFRVCNCPTPHIQTRDDLRQLAKALGVSLREDQT